VVQSGNRTRTERLEIRPVVESDKPRFVDLFMDSDFMLFSATGSLDRAAANARFDHMRVFSRVVPFGKQAIIEISTASLIGYVGADEFTYRGERRFEFGYRLVPASRGLGYATEASRALLKAASQVWQGELLAIVDPANVASRNVLVKTGFRFVESIEINTDTVDLYSLLV
jgi:RimJ/RimL family protein N-acetyltransferase